MNLPIDYCPHCDCYHVISEHPRDDESEQQYWQRMEDLEDAFREGACESAEAAATTDWDYGRE